MNGVFVDTHYLIAIINRLDQWHEPVVAALEKLEYPVLLVTDCILIETLNFFSRFNADAKWHAVETVADFLNNSNVELAQTTSERFREGINLYKSRLDKGYSLTDCISMNVCREAGIT